ncbi:hypothetical protein STEG23_002786 [Scotinomys teguina]
MRGPAKALTQRPTDVQTQQPAARAVPLNMCLSHTAAGRHQAGSKRCFKQAHTAAAHSRAQQQAIENTVVGTRTDTSGE